MTTFEDHGDDDILAFVDGRLDGPEQARVQRRIAGDPALQRRVRELRAVDALLDELPAAAGADALVQRTLALVRSARPVMRRPRTWQAAAAAVVILAAGTWLFVSRGAGPGPAVPPAADEPVESTVDRVVAAHQDAPARLREVADTLQRIESIQSTYFGSD